MSYISLNFSLLYITELAVIILVRFFHHDQNQEFKIQGIQDAYHYFNFYAFLYMIGKTFPPSKYHLPKMHFCKVVSCMLNEYLTIFAEARPLPNSAC